MVFQCTECGKQFGIKLKEKSYGSIVVIDVHYLKAFSQLSQINVPAMQRESCKEIFGRFIDHIRKIRNISPENQEEE